jgi:hypothetical protein
VNPEDFHEFYWLTELARMRLKPLFLARYSRPLWMQYLGDESFGNTEDVEVRELIAVDAQDKDSVFETPLIWEYRGCGGEVIQLP